MTQKAASFVWGLGQEKALQQVQADYKYILQRDRETEKEREGGKKGEGGKEGGREGGRKGGGHL